MTEAGAVRVKICGITDAAALRAATEAGADWVGFTFYPPSPRAVTPAEAAALSAAQPGGPLRVGLFVNPSEAEIASALDALDLDVLQIHAEARQAADMRRRFGIPVWHAVGIGSARDLPAGGADDVDGFVLDAKKPHDAALPGGNAVAFDWSILQGWRSPRPWLLAGGLTPANVAEAIARSGAKAVDVASGVESRRGVKDPALIRAFVARARAGDQGGSAEPG